jgi:DNA gyrase subunit B
MHNKGGNNMIARDYGKEIDGINAQLEEIKNLMMEFARQPRGNAEVKPLKNVQPMHNMHPDKRLSELMDELCTKTDEGDTSGFITYLGVFASGGKQCNWISNQVNADMLLELIESNIAVKMLACIGNNDRLNMLLALLRSPRSVAQLVEECGYNTTGQVYHLLKPLLAADLVKEDEHNRGSYVIQPHRVQGIIMLLAGISDMVDTKYTQGVHHDN